MAHAEILAKWQDVRFVKNAYYSIYHELMELAKVRRLDSIEKEQLRVVSDALRPSFSDAIACILLSMRDGLQLPELN